MAATNHVCYSGHFKDEVNPSETAREFVPSRRYAPGFNLNSRDYDGPGNFTLLPCYKPKYRCGECGKQERRSRSIIVAIHGACRQGANARSVCAVYHAAHSRFNQYVCRDELLSDQQVALWSICTALDSIKRIQSLLPPALHLKDLQQLIIKTDSEWLVEAMTKQWAKWRVNGFKNKWGNPLADVKAYQDADERVSAWANTEPNGVEIFFWLVTEDQNQGAIRLANTALISNGRSIVLPSK